MNLYKVALHGVPRSGTSWLGSILDSSSQVIYRHQPLFSYALKSFLDENSNANKIEEFFSELRNTRDDFIIQKEGKINNIIPQFNKSIPTHIIYKEARYHHIIENMMRNDKKVKVVGIVRNPKSVLSSWVEAPKEFNKEKWDIFKEWDNAPSKNEGLKEEFYGYQKWKEVAELFLDLQDKYPNRFYLINYFQLLNNTEEEVGSLFNFLKLTLGVQTLEFLRHGQKVDLSEEAYSVYRISQSDDKWKKSLPREIINTIDEDLSGSRLEKFL